jgi:serine/threonine protein kinase
MGEVFRARDARLKRDVALKVLPAASVGDADRRSRFEREAQVLASLNHPSIAEVFGVEADGSSPVIVMEFVDGPTLADRICGRARSRRRPWSAPCFHCARDHAPVEPGICGRRVAARPRSPGASAD